MLAAYLIIPAGGQAEEVNITVNGMVCSFCAYGIERGFKKEDSVEKISVDLDNKIVRLSTKEGQNLSDATIQKIIKNSGFNVEAIQRQ